LTARELVACRVVCVKVVGATLSEGFLVLTLNSTYYLPRLLPTSLVVQAQQLASECVCVFVWVCGQ